MEWGRGEGRQEEKEEEGERGREGRTLVDLEDVLGGAVLTVDREGQAVG